ncbi:MFS transporter [Hansschlegelia quercus]|uniref:MFS transporter n=1 Tax=Hansschlegelia quercus TaxID=2528245 RepID=A0A4V2JDC2_9HYPH|nr:MFS transporter [Hansschlegelia quercus]
MNTTDPAGEGSISSFPARVIVGLGGLYVTQSVIGGVVFTGLPAVMRQNGASLNDIAFILLTVLPWSFKFLWAPWVERYRSPRVGLRRSRTVIGLVGACAVGAVIACALIGPTSLGPLMVAMMIASFSSATLDIACDGHAVESLTEKNHGWANSAQVGGAYIGAAIGGGLFLVLIDHLGWTPSALIMAGVLVALALPFLTTPDGARSARPDAPRQSLMAALKRPEILSGIALISLYVLGQKWSSVLISPFLIDAGLSLTAIGVLNGVGVTVAGLIGAVSGGYVVRRFGAFPVMAASMAAQVLATVGFALYAYFGARSPIALVLLGLLSSGAISLGIVAVYSELMGRASLDQAGVDFTLFQSMDGIVSLIGWWLVSSFGDTLGFAFCFAACALLGIVALGALPILARRSSTLPGKADQRA